MRERKEIISTVEDSETTPQKPNVLFYIIVVVSLVTCTILGYLITTIPGKQAKTNYDNAVDEAYSNIYERSRAAAEEKWHVSNSVDIQIGDIKESANLQVLKVCGVEYVMNTKEEEGIISCLEVTGSGDYTVDLIASEFVVDNNRKYVLVRIPEPVFKNYTTDERNILMFKDGIFNKNTKQGVELAEDDLKEAAKKVEIELASNVDYYERAKEAAKIAVENLVKELNANVIGLNVEVEFFE